MHGFHKGLARRIEALERRLGSLQEPETPAVGARRLELVRAAHVGREPEDLQAAERPVFARITASVPIVQELIDEGALDECCEDLSPTDP